MTKLLIGGELVAGDAEIVSGGDHAGHDRGWFLAPTVVTGAAASTDLLREETFGPVAPIVPVKSLDEAIELANGTRFGLGANVNTRDLRTIIRCMRELGQERLEAFQETKHVHIESELAPKDWRYPYGGGGAPPHG